MSDDSNVLPSSRLLPWIAVGILIVIAVGLYFREGRTLPPLTAPPATRATPSGQPAS